MMKFTAALLAGGRSSRMGRDKAFLEIEGVPLWQRQLQTLRELNPAEIFVAARKHPDWMEADLKFVVDAAPGDSPLAGLVSVLRRCRTSHLLVLAVDLPKMTPDFFRRLLGMCSDNTGVVPKKNSGASFQLANQNKGKLKTCPTLFEPLAAVYPRCCLPLAESFLKSENYSLQRLAERAVREGWMTTREIDESERSLFLNLNTPSDLAAMGRK